MALTSLPALANVVPVTNADIHAWVDAGSSSPPSTFSTNNGYAIGSTGVDFSSNFREPVTGAQYADVATPVGTPLGIAVAANDVLQLYVYNHNERPWYFSLLVNGAVVTPAVQIVNGTTQLLTYVFGSSGILNSFGLQVNGNIGTTQDRTAQYTVSVVPLPGALLLLGSGLVGLVLLNRGKKAKPAVPAIA